MLLTGSLTISLPHYQYALAREKREDHHISSDDHVKHVTKESMPGRIHILPVHFGDHGTNTFSERETAQAPPFLLSLFARYIQESRGVPLLRDFCNRARNRSCRATPVRCSRG